MTLIFIMISFTLVYRLFEKSLVGFFVFKELNASQTYHHLFSSKKFLRMVYEFLLHNKLVTYNVQPSS